MRIAGKNKCIDTQFLIFPQAQRDGRGITDQRRPRAAAHESNPSPQVGAYLEFGTIAVMQFHHAFLTDRIVTIEEPFGVQLEAWIRDTDVDGFNLAYAVTPESFSISKLSRRS
jgi:hypothetical protein